MRVGVIGCGGWGRIVANNCVSLFDLVGVFDASDQVRRGAARELGTKEYGSVRALAGDCDSVVIATPPNSSRVGIVEECLGLGSVKRIRFEKPLAANRRDADALIGLCDDNGIDCYVGYTAAFNDGVMDIAHYSGNADGVFKGVFRRLSSVPARHASTPFTDLAPHDLATAAHITGELPQEVSDIDDGGVDVRFTGGSVFRFETSWDSPHKQRMSVIKRDQLWWMHDEILGEVTHFLEDGSSHKVSYKYGNALERDLIMWESGVSWVELDESIVGILEDVTKAGERVLL